jgi:hypothetical protein
MARSRVRAKFKPDRRGFTEFATSDQMLEPLYEAAHDVRRIAQATAPRSSEAGTHYADQFKVDAAAGVIVIGTYRRRIVTVVNQDKAAAPNEFGNKHMKGTHPLATAGSMIGDYRGAKPND